MTEIKKTTNLNFNSILGLYVCQRVCWDGGAGVGAGAGEGSKAKECSAMFFV